MGTNPLMGPSPMGPLSCLGGPNPLIGPRPPRIRPRPMRPPRPLNPRPLRRKKTRAPYQTHAQSAVQKLN